MSDFTNAKPTTSSQEWSDTVDATEVMTMTTPEDIHHPLEIDTDVPDEAESILGVAISRQQTQLTSPKTPAVEKARILQDHGGFFTNVAGRPIFEENADLSGIEDVTATPATQSQAHSRSGSRLFLRTALNTRKRASSGPESTLDSLQKALLSIPRKFSLSTSQPEARQAEIRGVDGNHNDRQTVTERQATNSPLYDRPHVSRAPTGWSSLRRAVSDESLTLGRSFSQVSSLGDDSRFQGVHAQVNSRFKAIKDSWQESNIKMPSIPSLPSIPSIASIRSELFGDRNQSQEKLDAEPSLTVEKLHPTDPMTRSPYHNLREAAADVGEGASPQLNIALARLEGDVVVLGGYRGSILRSSTPPYKQMWVPIKVGLNIRKVDLEVGIEPEDDFKPAHNVMPGGMLTHIGPVDISKRLFKRLRNSEACRQGRTRVLDYGYDWRLDPSFLSHQLCAFLEKLPCNQPDTPSERRGATVIAHSLGGLITRHAINYRPELFRGVVYAGVPTRCVNILGPLRNGDDVLLSSRVLTAQVNFTIRTSFALLPLDGRCFVDKNTHKEYPVDFFNPKTWLEHRLSPCIARPLVSLKAPNGIMSSVVRALPALPAAARKMSITRAKPDTSVSSVAEPDTLNASQGYRQSIDASADQLVEPTVSTTTSIPPQKAYAYLERMLASVKKFKLELEHRPDYAERNLYPPIAVIFGKNTPTVIAAKVDGIDGIKRVDAYDNLAFGSGDGVVLARAAMLPPGYSAARGGVIPSERGHVSLLGDLEAVGRALNAIMQAQEQRC